MAGGGLENRSRPDVRTTTISTMAKSSTPTPENGDLSGTYPVPVLASQSVAAAYRDGYAAAARDIQEMIRSGRGRIGAVGIAEAHASGPLTKWVDADDGSIPAPAITIPA